MATGGQSKRKGPLVVYGSSSDEEGDEGRMEEGASGGQDKGRTEHWGSDELGGADDSEDATGPTKKKPGPVAKVSAPRKQTRLENKLASKTQKTSRHSYSLPLPLPSRSLLRTTTL